MTQQNVVREDAHGTKAPKQGDFWYDMYMAAKVGRDTTENGYPYIRLNGFHYVACNEVHMPGRGYSMILHMLTGKLAGREVHVHNVWDQGEIPAEYRDVMPDNARYVTMFEMIQRIKDAGRDGHEIPFLGITITYITEGVSAGIHKGYEDGAYGGIYESEYKLASDLLTWGYQFNTQEEQKQWDLVCKNVSIVSNAVQNVPNKSIAQAELISRHKHVANAVLDPRSVCLCGVSNWASLDCPKHTAPNQ